MSLPAHSQLGDGRARELHDVHFHQGPQRQPVPCYDSHCRSPRMSSDDVREAALVLSLIESAEPIR
jgi:hypothetical protein